MKIDKKNCQFVQDGEGQVRCTVCRRVVKASHPPEQVNAKCPKTLNRKHSPPDAMSWSCPGCSRRYLITSADVPFSCVCGHVQKRAVKPCKFVLASVPTTTTASAATSNATPCGPDW
ncbi:MAG: hypothetical protein RIC55_17850 [Pirellulaceae bacterium]